MIKTKPIFILGSGRCGTYQIIKLIEKNKKIEAHHEYLFETILKPAVLYRMGHLNKRQVKKILASSYAPAIHYSSAKYWIDSSNALPYLIQPLYELFPNAHFIHLLRDGRKVVSSFYNKFSSVMYEDHCVNILMQWLKKPSSKIEPPNEKKYWRPIPVKGDRFACEFKKFNQFERLCYYWRDINLKIDSTLSKIPKKQKYQFHLENIVADKTELARLLDVMSIKYNPNFLKILKKPVNVHIPKNYLLTQSELKRFMAIAGDAMEIFGYHSTTEYEVAY